MNLGFRTHFPFDKKRETKFEEKIQKGIKIHTLREDQSDRFTPGRLLHLCTGIRTKNYRCFELRELKGTQTVVIDLRRLYGLPMVDIFVDDRLIAGKEITTFITNDGFDSMEDFFTWFAPDGKAIFKGKVIHWTDFRY